MSFALGTPVTLMEPSLTSVILPSGLIVMRRSGLASMRLRAYWDVFRACSSARRRSLMSRAMEDPPRMAPVPSRVGEMVTETGTEEPSFRMRMAS